jgi:enamine deaminase RidA (YjgF/YER057c/UK114 family)
MQRDEQAQLWPREDTVTTRFINPQTLAKPPSYTHVVEVTGPGRTIYISGQLGTGDDGRLVAADFRTQAQQVFDNLNDALASVGATFNDVVKVNSYLADIAHLPIMREVRAGYLNAAALPASTTLAVSKFAREGALLEVEAIAVLPARQAAAARRAPRAAKRAPRRRAAKAKVKARRKAR